MDGYSVSELAKLAGISVRTLHHYDRIGLLVARRQGGSGYRCYQSRELERLQQILFFRELDFPLKDIRMILDSPEYSRTRVLREHRESIRMRIEHLSRLKKTLDTTLENENGGKKMKDNDLFTGFEDDHRRKYLDEARKKYGNDVVDESEARMAAWGDGKKAEVWNDVGTIGKELAELMNGLCDAPAALDLARRQFEYVNQFWDCDLKAFRELGAMYEEDFRFAEFYERIAPGLSVFFRKVIEAYTGGIRN